MLNNLERFIVTKDGSHTLYSNKFKATYHSTHGAIMESEYVFIKNGLIYKKELNDLESINILEMGFGTGLNAYLTYLKANEINLNVNYHTVEAFPVMMEESIKLNYFINDSSIDKQVFYKLHECEWNRKEKVSNQFVFTKYLNGFENFKTDLKFDLIYYDAFSPNDQPELWTIDVFKKIFELIKDEGILVTYCAKGQVKRNLKAVGFKVEALPGPPGKREMIRVSK